MNATPQQQAEAGALVAESKAMLHEAEQAITAEKIGSVDWVSLLTRLEKLIALIKLLKGGSAATEVPTPQTPTKPHASHRRSSSHK